MGYALLHQGTVVTGTGTSFSLTFASPPTAGNLLIMCWAQGNNSGTSMSVDPFVSNQSCIAGASVGSGSIWSKIAVGGDANPTVGPSTSTTIAGVLLEFTGNAAGGGPGNTGPVDQNNAASGTSSPLTATNGAVDSFLGDLAVGVSVDILKTAATTTSSHSYGNNPANAIGNNDSTSSTFHWRFSYGVTTSGIFANSLTETDTSSKITGIGVALCDYAPLVVVPRNQWRNYAPLVRASSWMERAKGLLVPPERELWRPELVTV